MASITSLVSPLQKSSINILWLQYDLKSDGRTVTIGGDLSLAIGDARNNVHIRHHLKMVMGIEPDVLQILIQEFGMHAVFDTHLLLM
jgi:hypothetical protein